MPRWHGTTVHTPAAGRPMPEGHRTSLGSPGSDRVIGRWVGE